MQIKTNNRRELAAALRAHLAGVSATLALLSPRSEYDQASRRCSRLSGPRTARGIPRFGQGKGHRGTCAVGEGAQRGRADLA